MIIDQKVATNPDEIADGLNKYFNDIGTVFADNLPNGQNSFEAYVNPIETSFEIQNISVAEVKSEISRTKTSKATAQDRISPKLLEDSVEVVAESLTNIFNKSIEKGMFPDNFKIAYISPIHKGIAN